MASNTDVVGMGSRADGGGLGQDGGLSRQLQRILTAKLPLLNSPGTVIENSLYYDTTSSTVHAVEMQSTFAKDRISLQNVVMGSSATAYIPSVLFAGTVWWVGRLNSNARTDIPDVGSTNLNNLSLSTGYGFDMLNSIVVYLGASSVAQVQISGKTNFMIAMAACETEEKKRMVLQGAGKAVNTLSEGQYRPVAVGAMVSHLAPYFVFNTATSYQGQYYEQVIAPVTAETRKALASFAVPLRLPWTSLAALAGRLSFDTKLCTQPIQVVLEYKSRASCMATSNSSTPAFLTQFDNFESSSLQLWQEELIDKSLSVRNELLAMPQFNVGWPFQYLQSIPFNLPETDNGTTAQPFEMNLTSIINADLTTMFFMVSSNYRNNTSKAGPNYDPLYGERLYNIELKLNGQRFFNFDDDIYPNVYTSKLIGLPWVNYRKCLTRLDAGATDQFAATTRFVSSMTSHVYELNNSKLRAIANEASLQNTCRFTNQTFQIKFNVDREYNWATSITPAVDLEIKKQGYVLHMCYAYNGVFLIGGDGGTTKLITN